MQALLDRDFPTDGLTMEHGLVTPHLAFGTHNEIADQFRRARDTFGVSYFVTRDIEAMAPVVAQLREDG